MDALLSGRAPDINIPLITNRIEALNALAKWYSETPVPITPDDWKDDTNEARSRRRYRITPNKAIKSYFAHESQWRIWSLYLKMVPKHITPNLLKIISHVGKDYADRLGDISVIYHKYQDLLDENWPYYTELSSAQDYAAPIEDDEVETKVRHWVTHHREHEFKNSKHNFLDLYRQGWDKFLSYVSPFQKMELTVNQFLTDPMFWATPGASYEKRLSVETEKGQVFTRKSKWATAIATNLKERLEIFWREGPQTNRAIVKREPKKSRLIIVGDLPNYLRMAYISYWLEDVLREHPHTTLFYSKHKMLMMWFQMALDTQFEKDIAEILAETNIPIDEAEFDHQVNQKMNAIHYDALEEMISRYAPQAMRYDMLAALAITRKSTLSSLGSVQIKRWKLIYVVGGLLSGWRWTAFFGTGSNAAKVEMFRKVITDRLALPASIADPIIKYTSQGDDVKARARSPIHAQMFFDCYDETSFIVNNRKTFMERSSDDFLRLFARDGNLVSGYPVRGILSILYRNPVSREAAPGEDRIFELASNWLTVARRCKTELKVFRRWMVADIAQANGLTSEQVNDIVDTPASYGGLGLGNEAKSIHIKKGEVKIKGKIQSREPVELGKLSKEIQVMWEANVDVGPKVEKEFQNYEIEITDSETPRYVMSELQVSLPGKVSVNPDYRQDLYPSVLAAYKERAKKATAAQLYQEAHEWLEPSTISVLANMKSKMSLRIIKQWLTGDLPYRVPQSLIQGPTVVSTVYKLFADYYWQKLTLGRVNKNSLQKALYTAEQATLALLPKIPIQVLG